MSDPARLQIAATVVTPSDGSDVDVTPAAGLPMQQEGVMGERVEPRRWPIRFHIGFRRCPARFYGGERVTQCNRLIWPWQRLVREWDPECGGPLVHHECHHRSVESLYSAVEDEPWTDNLDCEHVTGQRFGEAVD